MNVNRLQYRTAMLPSRTDKLILCALIILMPAFRPALVNNCYPL